MTGSTARWSLLAAVWLGFTAWYTNLRGPLGPHEVEAYLAQARAQGRAEDGLALLRAFMEADDGRQLVMVNLLDMAPTGADAAMDRYMAHMWPALLSRACHPVFAGTAVAPAMDVSGIDEAQGGVRAWDQGALMRYRSRRDLLDIALDPAFVAQHEHKLAALTKTIAVPVSPSLHPADARLLLLLVVLVVGLGADRVAPAQRAGS